MGFDSPGPDWPISDISISRVNDELNIKMDFKWYKTAYWQAFSENKIDNRIGVEIGSRGKLRGAIQGGRRLSFLHSDYFYSAFQVHYYS